MGKMALKKILRFCIMATVLIALNFSTALAKQREFGQVTGAEVNMRAEPSKNAALLEKLPVGDEVEVLDEVKGDDDDGWPWYKVVYDGKMGYIRTDWVFVRSISDRIAYCLKDDVNLRGGPGQSAYIVYKLQAGKAIRVKRMVGEWYYVSYEGHNGFVHKDLLQLSKQQGVGYDQLLTFGMAGMEVKRLQQELSKRNFLDEKNIDGSYGDATRSAIKEFQKMAELSPADGVAGPATIGLLYSSGNSIKKPPKVPKTADDLKGRVQMIDWWNGGNKVLKRPGGVATVFDVRTGKTFRIRRTAGTNHNDVVPYSAEDTAIMKSIVGSWTWERRAIVVIVGSKAYAASMNCMPHSPDPQKNDNFPGHFCVHFTNSRTHGGNRVDPDHKRSILYAYEKFK